MRIAKEETYFLSFGHIKFDIQVEMESRKRGTLYRNFVLLVSIKQERIIF